MRLLAFILPILFLGNTLTLHHIEALQESNNNSNSNNNNNSNKINNNNNTISSEKCSEAELDKLWATIDLCYVEAQLAVDEALATGQNVREIKNAICKSTTAKVKCAEHHVQQCYNSTLADNVRTNLLLDELEKVLGSGSSQLGSSFVASCPVLRDNVEEAVRKWLGSNVCSYSQFEKALSQFKKCRETANQDKEERITLLYFASDQRTAIVKTMCDFKLAFSGCRVSNYTDCLGEEEGSVSLKSEIDLLAEEEFNIREMVQDFSFRESCVQKNSFIKI